MRKTWCVLGVAAVVSAAVGTVQSGDPAEPRAIIDRAIKALGGEANLSKHKAITMKGGGMYYGAGDGVPYTGEWAFQLPGQMRVAIDSKAGDQPFRFVIVVNGDKAWNKFGDNEVMEMNKEQVAEQRERLYANWVATLVPLKDKAFKLAALGEVKVQDLAAVGVRVSREGHRDISVYFDKVSGLPCKTETVVKNIENGGDQEVQQEAFASDYKEFDGVKHYTKSVMKRDGKRFVDVEFSEIRPAEKLDDSIFARP
jgi:outer membrane lipoprotein-sorting protein